MARDLIERNKRRKQNVDVICHENIGPRLQHFSALRLQNGAKHALGDARILQPEWSCPGFVQDAVIVDKSLAGGEVLSRWKGLAGQGAVAAPGDEQILAGRLPVGQPASIICHYS